MKKEKATTISCLKQRIFEFPLITIEDLFFNEMVWFVFMLGNEIIRKRQERTKEELYIVQIYEVITKIQSCFTHIDQAIHFIRRRPTLKELDKNEDMTIIDYYNYHYDVIIHKLSTIRDLSFKLINHVFGLNLDNKHCNWTYILRKKELITIPGVLDVQRLFYYLMREVEYDRNESSHNGNISIKTFKEIDMFVLLSQLKRLGKIPEEIIDYDPMAKGTYNDFVLRKKKKELLKKIDHDKAMSLFFIHVLTCCISREFKSRIFQKTLDKYTTVVNEANRQIDSYERKINKLEYLIPYLIRIDEVMGHLKDNGIKI